MTAVIITEFLSELNWLAVLVATVAWFVYSAIYYSLPMVSKAWAKAAKIPEQQGAPLVPIMVATLVLYFFMATVIGLLVAQTGAHDVADGLALGAVLGLAFGAAFSLVGQMYEQKGSSYWLINGVNATVSYMIVATILAVWD